MQREYLKIDPITERKLLQQLSEIEGKIPLDCYIKIKQLLEQCISKQCIHISQLEEIIQLLTFEEQKAEEDNEQNDEAKKQKKTVSRYRHKVSDIVLLNFMHQCELRKTLVRLYLIFNDHDNGITKSHHKF